MAYQPLDLDPSTPSLTRAFITGTIEPLYFSDVHAILRLPIRTQGITGGGNFAVIHVLLATIGGASTVLAKQSTKVKASFMDAMKRYYPWDAEADGTLTEDARDRALTVLIDEFRNPLTHSFGIESRPDKHGALRPVMRNYRLKAIRMQHGENESGLPEEMIEHLESSREWPFAEMAITVSIELHKKTVNVERLYWGTRRMIERITEDQEAMRRAECFLTSPAQ
jgi:hypothetical protein